MNDISKIPEIIDAKRKLEIVEKEYQAKLKVYTDEHSRDQKAKRFLLKETQKNLNELLEIFQQEKSHKIRYDKLLELYSLRDTCKIQLDDLKNIRKSIYQAVEKCNVKTIEHLTKKGEMIFIINNCNIDFWIENYTEKYESFVKDAKSLESKTPLTIEQLNEMEKGTENLFDEIRNICKGLDKEICNHCKCAKVYTKWGHPESHTTNSGSWASERYICRKKE